VLFCTFLSKIYNFLHFFAKNERVLSMFRAGFLTTTFGVDERRGAREDEDGSRLGLPESGDGVGEFVLEDFDKFLFPFSQLAGTV